MTDLYHDDLVLWLERQRDLLRQLAAGTPMNEAPDWPNIIEEIDSVGQSQVDQVESWLFQMAVHLLKASAWPLSDAVPNWEAEARGFRAQVRRKYRASMAQKIDLPGLYADALPALPETIDGTPPSPVSPVCPWTMDQLLRDNGVPGSAP